MTDSSGRQLAGILIGGFICVSLAIVIIQATPLAFFAMLLFIPFWIGALLHVLLAALGLLAAIGAIHRGWLLAPLIYYGGGYGLYQHSLQRAQDEVGRITRDNAAQSASVERPFAYTAGDGESSRLFDGFKVARDQSEPFHYMIGAKTYAVVNRIDVRDESECQRLPDRSQNPFAPVSIRLARGRGPKCAVRQMIDIESMPEERPRYIVDAKPDSSRFNLSLTGSLLRWTARDRQTDKVIAQTTEGFFQTMTPAPFVIVNCWRACELSLMSGAEKFYVGVKPRAGATPYADKTPRIGDDPETWDAFSIARALGLEPRKADDR